MSSQASSAGRDEAVVRQKLIETGDVDAMMAIRGNFFYTRSVPCELWFLNKNKPKHLKDKVLMIDARHVYRKVTRKIMDFSPEQLANLTSIVWLYRGETDRFLELVSQHQGCCLDEAIDSEAPVGAYLSTLKTMRKAIEPFLTSLEKDAPHAETWAEFKTMGKALMVAAPEFQKLASSVTAKWQKLEDSNSDLHKALALIEPIAGQSRDLIKDIDHLYKLASRLIDLSEQELDAKESDDWNSRDINRARKALDEARKEAVEQLKQVRYFFRQAQWLQERFPDAELCDVPGLVKLVDRKELAGHDYSLTPGRYVGVAPEEVDEDFDFEEALRDIHIELQGLNDEAVTLAAKIAKNFEELGI